MGLYLCAFRDEVGDDELDGVEVGGYEDFHVFRATVAELCEGGHRGSRFPTLMSVADSGGTWSPSEARALMDELDVIAAELRDHPPRSFDASTWQAEATSRLGLHPRHLAGSFIDIDGEPLLDRLRALAKVCGELRRPIEFL